jgi:hypothetical protein
MSIFDVLLHILGFTPLNFSSSLSDVMTEAIKTILPEFYYISLLSFDCDSLGILTAGRSNLRFQFEGVFRRNRDG